MAADITDPLYSALPIKENDQGKWRLLKLAPMLTLLVHAGLVYLNLALCARAGQLGIISLLLCIAHVVFVLTGPRHRIACTLFDPSTLGRVGWPKVRMVWHDVDTRTAEVLRALMCLVHYFGVGMTFFNTEADASPWYLEEDGGRSTSWTDVDLLYFCVVIVSTVGYGHELVPLSPAGRVFTMFYSVSGFFALALIINGINNVAPPFRHGLSRVLTLCRDRCRLYRKKKRARRAEAIEPPLFYVAATEAMGMFVQLLLLNLLFCVLFMQAEDNWSFVDAFYHCMMTSTTVGFGEVAPETQRGRKLAIVHIIASTAFFSELISKVSAVRAKMALAKRRKALLNKQLDPALILQLDKNGAGVDKLEFVVGMLTNLGVVSHEDVHTFMDRFDQLDTDGSGSLDSADLAHMIEQNAACIKAELAASDPMSELDLDTQRQFDALDKKLKRIKTEKTGVDEDSAKARQRLSLQGRIAIRGSHRGSSSSRESAANGRQRRPSLHRRMRAAAVVAARTPAQNLRRWARRLLGASACMVLNIFWVCLFGAVATLSGLVGAAAVGKVLGQKLTQRSLRIATALALLCAALAIVACALTLLAWRGPASYYRLDPIVLDQVWGILDDEWHVMSRTAQPEARCHDWWSWHDVPLGFRHPVSNETFDQCVGANKTPWPTEGEHLDCLGQRQLDIAMRGGGYAFWSLAAIFCGFAFVPTIYVSLIFAYMANLAAKEQSERSMRNLVKSPTSELDSTSSSQSGRASGSRCNRA